MADDIVTRLSDDELTFGLRMWADLMDKFPLLESRQAVNSNGLRQAADGIERLRKQRDELAWAISWFLNGGSREKLEQRFKEYEATL